MKKNVLETLSDYSFLIRSMSVNPECITDCLGMLVFEPSTTISSRHVLTLAGTLILITKRNLQAEYIL